MKTALILGATSDIGSAIGQRFAQEGWRLILAARNPGATGSAESPVADGLPLVTSKKFDALDFQSHESFYDSLDTKPDVCVCAVGLLGDESKARSDWTEARRIIDTNYCGIISMLTIVARDFELRGAGTLIVISSVAGDRGKKSNYFYGSAKAGLSTFLSGLRGRMQKTGVHVMTIKPGYVRTKMTSGMKLVPLLTTSPAALANSVWSAFVHKKDVLYVPGIWYWIMTLLKLLPESIFKRLNL